MELLGPFTLTDAHHTRMEGRMAATHIYMIEQNSSKKSSAVC